MPIVETQTPTTMNAACPGLQLAPMGLKGLVRVPDFHLSLTSCLLGLALVSDFQLRLQSCLLGLALVSDFQLRLQSCLLGLALVSDFQLRLQTCLLGLVLEQVLAKEGSTTTIGSCCQLGLELAPMADLTALMRLALAPGLLEEWRGCQVVCLMRLALEPRLAKQMPTTNATAGCLLGLAQEPGLPDLALLLGRQISQESHLLGCLLGWARELIWAGQSSIATASPGCLLGLALEPLLTVLLAQELAIDLPLKQWVCLLGLALESTQATCCSVMGLVLALQRLRVRLLLPLEGRQVQVLLQ